jgi:hypothetical protein
LDRRMAQVYVQNDGSIPGAAGMQGDSGEIAKTVSVSSLPMRKRKQESVNPEGPLESGIMEKKTKAAEDFNVADADDNIITQTSMDIESSMSPLKRAPMPKAKEIRLEQNRKAARESRRRKKIMVEELQRSVIFFSRANTTLKQQNEELQRILLQAQSQIQSFENANNTQVPATTTATVPTATETTNPPTQEPQAAVSNEVRAKEAREAQAQQAVASAQAQQVQKLSSLAQQTQAHHAAQTAATQAMFESQGFPPAAARAAAQTFVAAPAAPNVLESTDGQTTSNGKNPTNTPVQATMAVNPWPFLVAMAPGQIPLAGVPQPQAGTATTGKADFNPYFAMQMPPYLTTVLGNNGAGLGLPMMQFTGLSEANKGTVTPNQTTETNPITNNAAETNQNRAVVP